MGALRISLHQRQSGSFITTINSDPEMSWVRNGWGECKLPLALTDAKALRKYTEFGTLVYIETPLGLPWGGVLDPDMDWEDDNTISMTAYSAEYLLSWRRSPINTVWKAGSAGALFKRYVGLANQAEDLLIREGSIWEGGKTAEETMDGRMLDVLAKKMAVDRGHDFWIDPVIDPTSFRLSFKANYAKRRGVNSTFALKEGFNIKRRKGSLKIQRKPINDLLGIGSGSDKARPTYIGIDATSRARYGLRQATEDFSVESKGAVKDAVDEKLRIVRNPRNSFRVALLDHENAFQQVRNGNQHPLLAQTFGFLDDGNVGVNTTVEILSMRYFGKSNETELNVEEVIR